MLKPQTACAGESTDVTRKRSDRKDAVFSVNSRRGFVSEKMLELRMDKVKEGMTGCQDAASRRGEKWSSGDNAKF